LLPLRTNFQLKSHSIFKIKLKIFQIALFQLDQKAIACRMLKVWLGRIIFCSPPHEMPIEPRQKGIWNEPAGGAHDLATSGAETLLGELSSLLQKVGSTDNLAFFGSVADSLHAKQVRDLPTLKTFLEKYQTQILLPLELPAIAQAHGHAARGEFRELIAFDQQLKHKPIWTAFASASQRVGRSQLKRLRPLRDQRGVQRYLAAVESGQAHAWHTIVYGLTLAIYSLPLRQGLSHYAEQSLRGFADAAARSHCLPESGCCEILNSLLERLPEAVEATLAGNEPLHIS
jgi:urease accessory protein UreF